MTHADQRNLRPPTEDLDDAAIVPLYRMTRARVQTYTLRVAKGMPRSPGYYGDHPPLAHRLTIDGHRYSFISVGDDRWVKEGDTISFWYRIKGKHRNILESTIEVFDANGHKVQRGYRR